MVEIGQFVEEIADEEVAAAVLAVAGMQRLLQVSDDMDDEAEGQLALFQRLALV